MILRCQCKIWVTRFQKGSLLSSNSEKSGENIIFFSSYIRVTVEETWKLSLGSSSLGLRDRCGTICADHRADCLVGSYMGLRTIPYS